MVSTGIGEDSLLSIILPFIHNAREGVTRLGKLIAEYGSHEGNGVIFSDKDEVWYMEIPTGHYWAASRLPDNQAAVIANQVSQKQIDFNDPENFMWADGLQEFVEKNNLNPDASGFNFRHIFGTNTARDHCYNTPRVWFGQNYLGHSAINPTSDELAFTFTPGRKLKHEDISYILSSHYNETIYDSLGNTPERSKFRPISMARCAESHILEIRGQLPESYRSITWFNFAPTAFNPYIPFYSNANATAKAYSDTTDKYNINQAYWQTRTVAALAEPDYDELKSILLGLDGYLVKADQMGNSLVHKTDTEVQNVSDSKVTRFLTEANERNAEQMLSLSMDTISKLVQNELTHSRLSFSINTDRLQN